MPPRKNERKMNVIQINKEEAEQVRKYCPENHIRRTNQQKSARHRYYMSEDLPGMELIAELRKTTTSWLSESSNRND